ncbi:MAG: HYR domain-containing protein [Lewinellaceae bacterium]|nr:HYR domain-containing protein [Lewinellaceae bacterium]
MSSLSIKNRISNHFYAVLLSFFASITTMLAAAPPPTWSVDPDAYEFNMNVVIRLNYSGSPSNAAGNIVGAFVGNELRGVANPVFIGGSAFYFLTVYSNQYFGETVHFQAYYAPDDAVIPAAEIAVFVHNNFVGNSENPFWIELNPGADFPPEISPILADTTLVSIPFDPLDLNPYLYSPDGDPISWSAQPGPNLNVSLINGVLTVTPVSPVWTGTDSVRIIVTENTANQLADTVTAWYTVLPDYGAPLWQNIPDQTIFQGEMFAAFDLDSFLVFNGPCRGFDFDVYPYTGSDPDPAWPVITPSGQTMSIYARPLFADVQLAGPGAKLAAFVNGNLAGWATPTGTAPNISYHLVLNNVGSGAINFRMYDAQRNYLYQETSGLNFTAGANVGSVAVPYQIQYSPLVPSLSANGVVSIAIDDSSWLGSYPIDFIVWDCDYPLIRRDTFQAVFSIITDIRPEITSPETVNFEENACSVLYDTQTNDQNDAEGAGLTYTLAGGADAARFSIDAQTGILSWAQNFSPDFENPADADFNNQYVVNIRVTNSSNLSDTLVLTVTVTNQSVEPVAATINNGANLICTNGSATLQANGGLSYQWSNGSTQSSLVVGTPGTYTVTATSSGSCTATASVVVAPPPSIAASGSNSPVCVGSPIQLGATPSGGTIPYAGFSWTGPDMFIANVEDPAAFPATAASAGLYVVVVTDAAGCTASASTAITISGNAIPSVSAGNNGPVCAGASLSLNATATGGSGSGYTYLWAGPNNYAASGANPPAFNASTNSGGVYMVTVTDNAGCSGSGNTSVLVYGTPVVVASGNSPVSVGANVQLGATATGGSGNGYNYQWSGPNNFTASGAQPAGFPATLAASGVYTVTVTDSNGCSGTSTVSITVVECPSITAAVAGAVCEGGQVVLQSTPSGGALPYASFAWTGPNGFTSPLEDPAGFLATATAAGNYNVVVTDQLGCSASATVSVTVYSIPSINAANNTPICEGGNVILTSTPSGGSGTYPTFAWTGPDFFGSNQEDPAPFTGTAASSGVYQIIVTDSHGCTGQSSTTVTVSPTPVITASNNGPLCIGANLNLQSNPTGGTMPLGFAWTGPNGFSSSQEDPSPFPVSAANAGVYTVTVTDAVGCSAAVSTTLTVGSNNAPSITATSNSPICAGNFLSLSSTPAGGTPPYNAFSWSGPNNYTSNLEDPAQFVAGLNAAGVYSVTVTDSKNCKGTATVTVQISTPNLNPTSNSPVCPGGAVQLNAGGDSGAGISYSWSGPNGFSSVDQNPVIPNAQSNASGTYFVTVNNNGCIGNSSVQVSVSDVTPPDIVCPANITIFADGNCSNVVGIFSPVSLSDNCAANPAFSQSPVASTVLSGHNDAKTVTLTGDDGNGNTASCSFSVTLLDVTPPTIVCPANVTLAANANCSGTVGAYDPASIADNCAANPTFSQSPVASTVLSGHNDAKTVTLTADDGNGNTAACSFSVTLLDVTPPTIVCPANVTLAADANCSGTLGAHAPASIADNCAVNPTFHKVRWPAPSSAATTTPKPSHLPADDGNGNTAACSFSVTLLDVTPPTIVCPANVTLAANANCSGTLGAYAPASIADNCAANPTFSQSPVASTVLIGHNDAKTVTLTGDDGNGNTAACSFSVTLLDVIPPTIVCPANVTLAADANCSGTVGAYAPASIADNCATNPTFSQSPVASTDLIGHNDAKTVTLTGDDGNGNTASCSFTVTLLDVTPPTIVCPANVTLAADANCSGTVGTYSRRASERQLRCQSGSLPKSGGQHRSSVATTTQKT